MGIYLNWLTVSDVKVSVAERGEEMGDGNSVTSPAALVLDEGDEPILIEGKRSSLAAMLKPAARALEPHRHAELTRLTQKARSIADPDAANPEVNALVEALDVALTILGREDLR
jgi:hypothetical protein